MTIAADTQFDTLRCEQDDRVLIVRIVDPPFNYMTARMQADVVRLVAAVETDHSVGAIVFTGGVPGRYITHYDIGHLQAAADHAPRLSPWVASALVRTVAWAGTASRPAHVLLRSGPLSDLCRLLEFQRALERISVSPAVWIAAIDGPCGGGGLEMSVNFDLRLCSPQASFLLPEFGIGLSTTFGGRRLAQLMGPTRALEMMLEARTHDADSAHALGLVDAVLPAQSLVDDARARAARYAAHPRTVVAAQKRIFHNPDNSSAAETSLRETIAQIRGLPAARGALSRWLRMQRSSGDSVFLTDPQAWAAAASDPTNAVPSSIAVRDSR